MARFCKYTRHLLLTSSLFFLFSCQEGSDAGDLLGQWRLNDSENYIAFSGSVVVMRAIAQGQIKSQIFGNFQRSSDSIFIQCYSIHGEPQDTITVEEGFGFTPFTNIRLKIEKLDADRLMFSKEKQTWNFNKY